MVTDHTDLAMALVRTVTHPSINWAHDCSTFVINRETLAPSYRGSSVTDGEKNIAAK